jgi:hypothetical protein
MFGNKIYTDYLEKKTGAVSSAINQAVGNTVSTTQNAPDNTPAQESNASKIATIDNDSIACYIICISMFRRLTEWMIERTDLCELSGGFVEESFKIASIQYPQLATFLTDVLGKFAEAREKKNFEFSGQAMIDYANNCYALWKRGSYFSYTCPAHLTLLPEKSSKDFAANASENIYSEAGLDKITDACRTLRASDVASDQYKDFLRSIPHRWIWDKIFDTVCIFLGNDSNASPVNYDNAYTKFFNNYDVNIMANKDHKYALRDATTFGAICALASNTKLNAFTDLDTAYGNYISDSLILALINAHLKDDEIVELKLRPVSMFIAWLSAISAGFSAWISSWKAIQDIGSESTNREAFCGETILTNLLNIGVKIKYRSIHLPMFQYRKDPVIEPTMHNGYNSWKETIRKNLVECMNRANQKDDYKITQDQNNRYKNLLEYISLAVCDNVVTAEYAVFMLLQLFDGKVRSALGLNTKFRSIEEVHPFKDIMQYILRHIADRDSTFYTYFDNQTKISYTSLMKEGEFTDNDKTDSKALQDKLLKFIEPLAFITILQRIVMADEYNKQLNSKFEKTYFSNFRQSGSMYGDNYPVKSSWGDKVENISSETNMNASIMEDISSAVSLLDMTVQEKLTGADWFQKNKDKLTPGILSTNEDGTVKSLNLNDLI